MSQLEAAASAVEAGDLVVYPTETVYGLGADALDPGAIEGVFAAKRRSRTNPLSMAVPSVADALAYVEAGDRSRACMDAFLPGPVTVVCPKASSVPDVLTGGEDRVGIRIPDHELALSLLEATGPITATSANLSGRDSVTRTAQLDPAIREAASVVVDGGTTSGAPSTVVDPERGRIHRSGAMGEAVASWLEEA